MAHLSVYHKYVLLYLQFFIIGCLSINHNPHVKVLNVGMELQQETIPLQNGYRFYNILGLKASKWYEVKISYSASIPSSFSIQLKSDPSDFGLNKNRRLLNTEKIIFNVKNHNWTSGDSKLYALVTVEPEGIVGKLHVQERELVIFNIVCDELALGISYDAWWIGILVLLCLGVALLIPYVLPPYLFQKDRISCSSLRSLQKFS